MSSNNPNLFTLNPNFFQSASCYQNYFSGTDDFCSTKSIWAIEKGLFQEKLQCLEGELKTQKDINIKLKDRIQELEAIVRRSISKEHQRVYSIPSYDNLNTLSSHNILNSFLMSFPDHKHKKTPFMASKFMEDIQNKKEEKPTHNKENETQDKKRLHHQKSNSFNTKSLVIVETTNHEQKTDYTTIHVNIQEGVLNTKNRHSKHLFNQKNARKKTPAAFESNSNSTTNLSNSNVSLSGHSSHETKSKEKPEKNEGKCETNNAKERLSFLTTEKSLEISSESNSFLKGNIANCYIFMSPAQRNKLISMPVKRKWTINKTNHKPETDNKFEQHEKGLVRESYMTKSAQNFASISHKNEKNKGTHLYRQGALLNELKFFANKKQYNTKLTLRSHLDVVRGLAVSNDRLTLASASEDNTIKLWDIKDFERYPENSSSIEPFLTLRDHKGAIFSIASRDDWSLESKIPFNSLFSAGAEGVIRAWSIPRKEEVIFQKRSEERSFCNYAWKAHNDCIWDLNLHSTSDLLTSSSSDGCIKMWKLQSSTTECEDNHKGTLETELFGTFIHKSSNNIVDIPTSVAWVDRQHQSICSGYVNSKALVLFDYLEKQDIKGYFNYESEAIDARTNKVLFDQALNCLISGHEDKNIRIFDLATGKNIKSFIAHNDSVTSLALNQNNSNQVISVSHDSSLRIWDLRKYQCLQEILIHRKKYDEAVHCLISSKYAPYLMTGGADACIKILKNLEH